MGLLPRTAGPRNPRKSPNPTVQIDKESERGLSLLRVASHAKLAGLSGQMFQSEYARHEKSIIGSIERYLSFLIMTQMVIYLIYIVINLIFLTSRMPHSGWPILMAILPPVISSLLFLWPVLLARRFFSLQRTKRIWMDKQEIDFRKDTRIMSESILRAAQRRVTQNIKIQGSQSQIVVAGGDVNSLTQALVINGSKEHVEGLGLLIEYARGSGHTEALRLAEYVAKESQNRPVNRAVLFDCWTKLTTILPGIAEITKIAAAVKALFV